MSASQDTVERALESIKNCEGVHKILLKVLTIGNILNAGREKHEQADGFYMINVVSKLKRVTYHDDKL